MVKNLSYGTGRRKTSIARVYIQEGAPDIKINGQKINEYFELAHLQEVIKQPLNVTANIDKLNILVNVHGGGITGQAGAIRHGLSSGPG